MKSKKEIIKSPEYWFEKIQNEFFRQFYDYIKKNNISQVEFAKKLNVTKGYISQILNGNFNPTLKKLIELSIAIDKIPDINFKEFQQFEFQQSKKYIDILIRNNSYFQINDETFIELKNISANNDSNSKFVYQIENNELNLSTLN